jgi:multidrug efflux system membrane fusion protein
VTPEQNAAAPPPRRRRFRLLWLLLLVALAIAFYFLFFSRIPRPGAQGGPGAGAGAAQRGRRGPGAIPVVATRATRGNIGVYLNGLGTVTPLNTVTVKSRVDGQLMEVLYREGDIVQKGALLVQIDPRPYQVQAEQAEGQLLRDQALLANARTDLARYQTLLTQNAIP